MMDQLAPWVGLLRLIGFVGFWIPGAGAIGASGALGLWNHQSPKLPFWGKLGWSNVLGLPYLWNGLAG